MKIKKSIILSIAVFIGLFIKSNNVQAESSTSIPFSIEAIIPSNQVENNLDANYLDLIVKPDQVQKISFIIRNNSDKEQHFVTELSDASTSDGISIDYGKTKNKLIKSPKISEMINEADTRKKSTLSPYSQQQIDFELTYPSSPIIGSILGGVSIYQDPDYLKNDSSNSAGIGINNLYKYALAVQLRSGIDDNLKPNIKIDTVKQDVENYRPVIKATLVNDQPVIVSQVSTSNVLKNQSGDIIEEYRTELGQIAPISQFDLTIPLKSGALKSGNYSLEGEAISQKTGDKWTWEKFFSIDDNNYKNTNDADINKSNDNKLWIILISIILLLILFMLIILILIRRNKQDKQ